MIVNLNVVSIQMYCLNINVIKLFLILWLLICKLILRLIFLKSFRCVFNVSKSRCEGEEEDIMLSDCFWSYNSWFVSWLFDWFFWNRRRCVSLWWRQRNRFLIVWFVVKTSCYLSDVFSIPLRMQWVFIISLSSFCEKVKRRRISLKGDIKLVFWWIKLSLKF